jgi:hypothetical protein
MPARLGKAAIALVLAVLATAAASPAGAAELVLDRASGFIVTVVVNGVPLRLRADPAASGLVILNPDSVRRAKIQPEMVHGRPGIPGLFVRTSYARIGPVSLTGRTGWFNARIGGQPLALRAIWFDRAAIEDADGLISIASLPYDSVTFRLAPVREGEREIVIPVDFVTELGLYHPYPLGGRAIPIQFSLWKPASIGTAAAGALIARGQGGAWHGGSDRRPMSFGILRPVRPMTLVRPLDLDGLRIREFLVRTADFGGGYALPADSDSDPDEIVVTAERALQQARLGLVLGADQFAACSSLRYERAAGRLVLSCTAPALIPPRG